MVLTALLLRGMDLTAGGIGLDEGYSLLLSELPFLDILEQYRWDTHPPLYSVVLHGWRIAFGSGPIALKSLSVLCGTLGVIAALLAVRRRRGPIVGILAGWFIAVAPFHIAYSRELRGYALAFLALSVFEWCFAQWVLGPTSQRQHRRARAWLVGWAIAAWVAVNTQYAAWYFVGVRLLFELLAG